MLKLLFSMALFATASLAAETNVLVLSGSTREDSTNKKLANDAAEIGRQMGAKVKVIDLRDFPMPYYDADVEQRGMPENAKRFRTLLTDSQAIIIASPEYNSSVSGVLKNALDWASRNEKGEPSREAFQGKKFAIMSASPGAGGGVRGLGHLQSIIQNVGGEVVATQVSVPNSYTAFDEQGHLKDPALREKLKQEIRQLLSQ
ncbi:NADPH-dependent FMN reductase [Candidatus Protochlamydia phocaeensis]|uniref:NADPH-dependent FMN reductase n=1 Tax=Candidatus Protochlamydia phocaeensis TaxID=1414722 RepID=UPI0009AC9B57|nr:NADPH-dependent FMN reductase [Candidatus Protochlamydia phocaeensis]